MRSFTLYRSSVEGPDFIKNTEMTFSAARRWSSTPDTQGERALVNNLFLFLLTDVKHDGSDCLQSVRYERGKGTLFQ
jgi:hypothetical protein